MGWGRERRVLRVRDGMGGGACSAGRNAYLLFSLSLGEECSFFRNMPTLLQRSYTICNGFLAIRKLGTMPG